MSRSSMNSDEADFGALTLETKMHHALAALHIAQPEQAQLLAPDAVIEQGGEDCPVAHSPKSVGRWRIEEPPRLGIPKGRVLPSLLLVAGRFTPSTGLPRTAFR
jgi:hypothetical protein